MKETFRAIEFLNLYERKGKNELNSLIESLSSRTLHSDLDQEKETQIELNKNDLKKKSAVKRKYEKTKHRLFVDECLSPKGYLNGDTEVFALIHNRNEGDSSSDSPYVEFHVSLLTPSMAFTDYQYFIEIDRNDDNKPWWYDEYRPYFYDLTLCISKDDKEWFKLYRENKEIGWFLTRIIHSDNSVERDNKPGYRSGLLRFGGSDTFSDPVDIYLTLKGVNALNLPADQVNRYYQSLQSLYKTELGKRTLVDYTDYLNNTLPQSITSYTIDILNVGQANCIHICCGSSFSFMFDVGVPFEEYTDISIKGYVIVNDDYLPNKGIGKNIARISKYKPTFILLSHWHYDHIAGFIHLCNSGLDCHWIAPQIPATSNDVTSMRLALYISQHDKLSLIEGHGNSEYTSVNSDIEIFSGKEYTGTSPNEEQNAEGLLLRIKNLLMTGDSLYRYWPDPLLAKINEIKQLVVPHHGSKINATDSQDSQVLKMFDSTSRAAYICFGNNGYFHPNAKHISELSINSFNTIIATGGVTTQPFNGAKGGNVSIQNNSITFTI